MGDSCGAQKSANSIASRSTTTAHELPKENL
jgi:hypothetical protein